MVAQLLIQTLKDMKIAMPAGDPKLKGLTVE